MQASSNRWGWEPARKGRDGGCKCMDSKSWDLLLFPAQETQSKYQICCFSKHLFQELNTVEAGGIQSNFPHTCHCQGSKQRLKWTPQLEFAVCRDSTITCLCLLCCREEEEGEGKAARSTGYLSTPRWDLSEGKAALESHSILSWKVPQGP